jgi:hypothetical protein
MSLKFPDDEVLQAIVNLDNSSRASFLKFQQWLLDCAAESDRVLRSAESTVLLHRAQGASGVLTELAQTCASARDLVVKARTRQLK